MRARLKLERSLAGLASPLAGRISPRHTQGVEYEGIGQCQLIGIQDNLVGVINNRIRADAPGFVTHDTSAMLACGFRTVSVAVKPGSLAMAG